MAVRPRTGRFDLASCGEADGAQLYADAAQTVRHAVHPQVVLPTSDRNATAVAPAGANTSTYQVEVVSFHYSDQLFLANAVEDWSRSADLTRATFAKWGVPLGKAVFCQEGQAGMGMAAAICRQRRQRANCSRLSLPISQVKSTCGNRRRSTRTVSMV